MQRCVALHVNVHVASETVLKDAKEEFTKPHVKLVNKSESSSTNPKAPHVPHLIWYNGTEL